MVRVDAVSRLRSVHVTTWLELRSGPGHVVVPETAAVCADAGAASATSVATATRTTTAAARARERARCKICTKGPLRCRAVAATDARLRGTFARRPYQRGGRETRTARPAGRTACPGFAPR